MASLTRVAYRRAFASAARTPSKFATFSPKTSSSPIISVQRKFSMSAPTFASDFNAGLYTPLAVEDPEVHALIEKETYRQFRGLELIASENLTSLAVLEANGSILTNKYSEGLPGARYYGGNKYIDELEILCQQRALTAFRLNSEQWGVNVQPYAGSTANFAAYTALIQPGDKLMGLGLADGGHLTHGAFTPKRKISASSIYFESKPYRVDVETGLIDYDALEASVKEFQPKLLICGASAYPRDFDYARFRKIADSVGAYLLMDMAHISGLVAAAEQNDPFEFCDVVCTTTHKTLRGPRAGLIFFRKDKDDLEKRVNDAVFPACQGGPHNNTIAGIAVALKQAASPEFKAYAKAVRANSAKLASVLFSHNYKIQTNGSDNHLILWDLRPLGITGSKLEKVCDMVHITLNKNSVQGDKSAAVPGGVRVGTAALTSRSMGEQDMELVGELLHRAVQIALQAQQEAGSTLLKDFLNVFSADSAASKAVADLSRDVEALSIKYPLPGVPDASKIKKVE